VRDRAGFPDRTAFRGKRHGDDRQLYTELHESGRDARG
jgi:hypothetical protein